MGERLSEANRKMLYIPLGFAHGFYTISEIAEVIYKCTGEYSKENERALLWNSPEVGIEWPLKGEPILSDQDKKHPTLKNVETDFIYKK